MVFQNQDVVAVKVPDVVEGTWRETQQVACDSGWRRARIVGEFLQIDDLYPQKSGPCSLAEVRGHHRLSLRPKLNQFRLRNHEVVFLGSLGVLL